MTYRQKENIRENNFIQCKEAGQQHQLIQVFWYFTMALRTIESSPGLIGFQSAGQIHVSPYYQLPIPTLSLFITIHELIAVCTFLNGWEEIQKVNVFLDVGNFYSLPLSHQSHTELVTRTGYTRPGALGHQPSGLTETPIRTGPQSV